MADAKKCDRCGACYTNDDKKVGINGHRVMGFRFIDADGYGLGRNYDLCDECMKELDDWINGSGELTKIAEPKPISKRFSSVFKR